MTTFHFISGLPRSGSTLLAAILKQNPRFHADMSSPVGALFQGVIATLSAASEFANIVPREKRIELARSLFSTFYSEFPEEIIFDTNRLWSSKLGELGAIFPQAKVVCTVRNTAWIMDSMERQYRNNLFENTKLFSSNAERDTVYSRINALGKPDRLVGFAYNALKEAFYSEEADALLLVDYDALARHPEKVLRFIYEFLGEPYFEHDFDNVRYDAPTFDRQLGVDGLHRVDRKVELRPRATILPPDLYEKYSNQEFWYDPHPGRASVIAEKK